MKTSEIYAQLSSINEEVEKLNQKKADLTWNEGVPAIISKMKEYGKDVIQLRELEYLDYFCTEDLWFWGNGGYFAAKDLRMAEDGRLIVVYTTLANHEYSYNSDWDYGDEEMEAVVDRKLSDVLITQIIDTMMENDEVYTKDPEDN